MAKLLKDTETCHSQAVLNFQPSPSLSCSATSDLSCNDESQQPEQDPYKTLRYLKTPAYWDNLSKLRLTKGALRELDRRNKHPESSQDHRPVTPRPGEQKKDWEPQFAPDFLCDSTPSCLKQIKSFSRLGGPDLSGIRGHPEPSKLFVSMDPSTSTPRKQKQTALLHPSLPPECSPGGMTKTTTTPYSGNFQQNLIDHGIYPDGFDQDDEMPLPPNNFDEIKERLSQRRPSLSASRCSNVDFSKFRRENAYASAENPVTTCVLPIIEGNSDDPKYRSGGYPFANLAPMTDGALVPAHPDRFFGAYPGQVNLRIRKELSNTIVPSRNTTHPIVPNLFLEAKGPTGTPAVVDRQACYNGAIGARGVLALQWYQQENPEYDNNAYTISVTYIHGTLSLYTTHPTKPKEPSERPEYVMTLIDGWAIARNLESFQQGLTAYRNARDWAKENRDQLIRLANERDSAVP